MIFKFNKILINEKIFEYLAIKINYNKNNGEWY